MFELPGAILFDPYYVDSAMSILSNVPVSDVYVDGSYTDGAADDGHIFGYDAFSTVQDGVDANPLSTGGTVHVAAGTYNETVSDNRALVIEGAEHGVAAADTSGTKRAGSESIVTRFNLGGSSITLDGFSLDNTGGIEVNVATSSGSILSGVKVENNVFTGYGSVGMPTENAGDLAVSGNFFHDPASLGEPMQIKANLASGCTGTMVSDNVFASAGTNGGADVNFSCTGSGSTGITVSGNTDLGNSGGTSFAAFAGIADGLSITDNTAASDGSTLYFWGGMTGATNIKNNVLTGGSSSSAISIHNALDGDNTGTFTISGNTLDATGYGIYIAAGALGTAGAVNANGNEISGNANYGIDNNDSSVTVNAEKNWWGDATGPYHAAKNPAGLANKVSDYVDFSPFCLDSGCTTFGSVDPIAELDLSASPASQSVPLSSVVTAMAKDALGYTVVNDNDATQIHFSVDSGASLGALYVDLGTDGSATTSVKNTVTGIVNVAGEVVGASPAVTGATTVTFTPGDTTAPFVTSTFPAAASTTVARSVVPYVDFSEPLLSTTVTSANIQLRKASDDSAVPATVALVEGGTRVSITPAAALDYDTQYYFAVSAGVTDPSGNALSPVYDSSNKSAHAFTTAPVPPDTTPPAISSIQATSIATSSASILWTTDEGATSQVEYGKTSSYGSLTALDSAMSAAHSVGLSALSPDTTYHYRVISTDASGNTTTSGDNLFTTAFDDSSATLEVSGIGAVNSFATADDSFSDGFSWVFHVTVPTAETNFSMKFSDFTSGTDSIPAANNIRFYSAQSSDAFSSTTAMTITAADTYAGPITLSGDLDPSTAGRQIDVTVEMKVPTSTPSGSYSGSYGVESL